MSSPYAKKLIPAVISGHVASSPAGLVGDGSHAVTLAAILRTARDSLWLIAGLALAFALLAAVYIVSSEPVYQSNLLIRVEEERQNSSKNILNDVSSLFDSKTAAVAEMQMIRSRAVIGHAVDQLHLEIEARPLYFPLLGAWLARRAGLAQSGLSRPGLLGYGGYAWGQERIELAAFEVPAGALGRRFLLTAQGQGRFALSAAGLPAPLQGRVGETLTVASPAGPIVLKVARLDALAGARFQLRRVSRLSAIESVQRGLQVSEQGKLSGVIEVRFQGAEPALVYAVLDDIGREYMRQNRLGKSDEADNYLALLNEQLPRLRLQLDQAETEYNRFRQNHGSIQLGEDARVSLEQAAAAKARRSEIVQRKLEMLTRLEQNHPAVAGVDEELREADREVARLDEHIRTLPQLEQTELKLTRDIKVNTELYAALSNTAQQLRVISIGKMSNVRLVDTPMLPERPVRPDPPLVIALAGLSGGLLGLLGGFARQAVRGYLDDPARIESLAAPARVHAVVPFSKRQRRLGSHGAAGAAPALLAQAAPADPAVEALRGLRAALLADPPRPQGSVLVMAGLRGAAGTSFVLANLAALLAGGGYAVLLIDAHCRAAPPAGHPCGWYAFSQGKLGGQPLRPAELLPGLDLIAAGVVPDDDAADCLLGLDPRALADASGRRYDVILVDSPPLLEQADARVLAARADSLFLVLRAGQSREAELQQALRCLQLAGAAPRGIVLNHAARHSSA